jgi:AcrR family transcriptional regulator
VLTAGDIDDEDDPDVVRRPPFGSNPLVGERGSDTQRRILSAALEVFGHHGYAEARVELITEKAGCSRPAFYQYFSSKDDVFWALAGQLAKAMVGQAKRLERVTPDAEGLAQLTAWLVEFMDLHEAWSPVFSAYQAATRDHEPEAQGSADVSDRTGLALLRAFGVPETPANTRIITSLVAVIIRVSFYAEQTPSGMTRDPLVEGAAQLVHRVLAGPIDGVNVVHSGPSRKRRVAVAMPEPAADDRDLRPRGEKTRLRLLEAGAKVLPARGYHDARVDDIVEAAGVSHGTFYRYFSNKDDFFRTLAEAASARMIDLIDRLQLDAEPDELRLWLQEWFQAYAADGGVISTWQEMQTNEDLAAFSQQVAASVFTRLVRMLDRRDFGEPVVDAVTLLAVLERVPYSVYTLQFTTEADAIESMITVIRRGLLALPD